MNALRPAETFALYIYQVTDARLCNWLESFYNNGGKLTVLVSNTIYSEPDYQRAQVCYKQLYDAGIEVRKTKSYMYSFSHQVRGPIFISIALSQLICCTEILDRR